MAREVQHKCDSCGYLLNPETDVISQKELTIEQDKGKISILIVVDNMSSDPEVYDHPALCCTCLASAVNNLANSGKNFIKR